MDTELRQPADPNVKGPWGYVVLIAFGLGLPIVLRLISWLFFETPGTK